MSRILALALVALVGIGIAASVARAQCAPAELAKLRAGDAANQDNFGCAIAVDGNTVVVGAGGKDLPGASDAGAAYVYVRAGLVWVQQARLVAADGAAGDRFGDAVAIDGDTVLVGAPNANATDAADAGAAYVFVRSVFGWVQQQKLVAGDAASYRSFGRSVALEHDTALVGSPGANAASTTHGRRQPS